MFRFLNMRHPRDYNTVPRYLFWLFHLLWLFPWSAFLPGIARLSYKPVDRAGRMRLLALCWTGFVLVFFTFSTTQEYYSMPIYPALALLLGCAMATDNVGSHRFQASRRCRGIAAVAIAVILLACSRLPTPGDISSALTQNPEAYTLSLGHMGDLTLASFAYLRIPLIVAGVAFLVGAVGAWRRALPGDRRDDGAVSATPRALRWSRSIRTCPRDRSPKPLVSAPPGQLIVDNQYYTFSSIFFYTNRRALLLNGRVNNLEYGSYAPGAPDVFIDDAEFARLWQYSRALLCTR